MEKQQLSGKGRLIEHGAGADRADVLGQFDPGLATAIGLAHGQFDRGSQAENADRQGVNFLGTAPIETLGDDVLAPDMKAAQGKSRRKCFQALPGGDVGKTFQSDHARIGHQGSHCVKARLGFGKDRVALLMKQSWKKQEFLLFNLKPVRPLDQTAFAQNNNLPPPHQRIDDDGPLFKRMSHAKTYHEQRAAQIQPGAFRPFLVCVTQDVPDILGSQ